MAEERPLYVAREEDLTALQQHWEAANAGQARFVRVVADFGGGRRALIAEFLRRLRTTTDEPLLWRVAASDQEHGVGWLMRMYGALVAPIATDVIRRGKVEMILNGQLPQQTRRVQGWYQQFVAAIKESKVDAQSGQVQLRIPQDNPLVGLVEIAQGIARKMPIILELQSSYVAHTVLVAQFLEALVSEATDTRLLVLIHDEVAGDVRTTTHPAPLLDLYERKADSFQAVNLQPWGEAETARFLESKGLSGNAAGVAAIAKGRPGFIAELVDILQERGQLTSDLSGVTLASLTPMAVDEDDLETPANPPAEGERRHATAEDALRVAHLAALLGHIFPSSLIAEMGGFDRESIDDLVDAMGDLYDEVQFSEQMGTWLYRFKRGCWREGVLEMHNTPEGQEITRRVAVFMERFLAPRGQAFMTRAARLYAEGQAWQRAAAMRAIALTNDAPDAWGMAWEMMRYFDEVTWTDTMRRTIMTTLLEHLTSAGNVQAAEQLHGEATTWAANHGDRDLQGWLLLTGSKLDTRRQDLFRARDRAQDAIRVFEALENRARIAEVYAHLSAIDLQDGQWQSAISHADKSLEYGTREQDDKRIALPAILAQAELTRGVVARRENKLDEAIQHFRQANEVAGTTGLGPLALEAGIALGEALAANRQLENARDVLGRVLQACRQLGATARERNTAQILAQVEGSLRNFGAALQLSQRVLQITQQMKFEQALAVDLYNVGFFNLTLNKGADAVPFFEQALERLKGQENHPLLKDLHYHYGLASLQAGKADTARGALRASLRPLQAAGDHRKLVTALDQLAALEHRAGNAGNSKKYLEQAITIADNADLKDEKRELKRRLENLG